MVFELENTNENYR
ncbi:unnamed protein product, partial [Allacma fusca]